MYLFQMLTFAGQHFMVILFLGLVFNKLRILDLCADGDARVRVEGDMTLRLKRPELKMLSAVKPSSGSAIPAGRNPGMQSTMGAQRTANAVRVTDELIYSGSSGCHGDDEDDCGSMTPSPVTDNHLITPILTVFTTPKPLKTTAPTSQPSTSGVEDSSKPQGTALPDRGSGTPDCDDEENCDGSGSGIPEPSKPPPTYRVTTDDIFYSTVEPMVEPQNESAEEIQRIDTKVHKSSAAIEERDNDTQTSVTSTTESMFITENITETHSKKTRQPVITSTPSSATMKASSHPALAEYVTLQEMGAEQSVEGSTEAGIHLWLIVGVAAGTFLILFFIICAIWSCKKKHIETYKIDEKKTFIDSKARQRQPNGVPVKTGLTMPKFEKSKKNVKEWYV